MRTLALMFSQEFGISIILRQFVYVDFHDQSESISETLMVDLLYCNPIRLIYGV